MTDERTLCRECGRKIGLRPDGKLMGHFMSSPFNLSNNSGLPEKCPGAKKRPFNPQKILP